MIAFNFEKHRALEVLDYFKKYYDLDESAVKELDKNFTEYAKLYESNSANLPAESYEHQEADKSQLSTLHNLESFLTQTNSESTSTQINEESGNQGVSGTVAFSKISENTMDADESLSKESHNSKLDNKEINSLKNFGSNVSEYLHNDGIDPGFNADIRISSKDKIGVYDSSHGQIDDADDCSKTIKSGSIRNLIIAGRDKDTEMEKEKENDKENEKGQSDERAVSDENGNNGFNPSKGS